ncbi:hypothetical protein [Rhodococcus globerulus]|uniref:Uncharacterized protein n=1 Tax=Rhodococcus globerulus TaxID=33008 RepID=A0ABU4C3N9_RHOGO|nr:hypothetical protein [Rhodococcus globerulus]MDV6271120.1 hypothetical protein [Rhodococcus globerulus]
MKRFFGTQSDWRDFHQREAFDVVIFDGGESGEHSVLVSAREDRLIKPVIIPALTALVTEADPDATVSTDFMPEALDSDFYLWLLYFHKYESGLLSAAVKITDINEIESSDRQRRSGKFGAGAGADRIELLALIAKDQAKFGPAKFSVRYEEGIEADLDLHVFPDGGYSVFKTSEYKDHRSIPGNMLGHKLVEDVFELVLPSIRSLYNHDSDWRTGTREEFIRRSKSELDAVSRG